MSVQSESARGSNPAPVSVEGQAQPSDDTPRRRSRRGVSAKLRRSGEPESRKPQPVEIIEPSSDGARILEASEDIFYLSAEGMESHLQIKGTDTLLVLTEAQIAIARITEDGGIARTRPAPNNRANSKSGKTAESTLPYYTDEQGIKRCNRLTVDGERCGEPVTQRDGQYGPFWSCPNYKNHAPTRRARTRG